jgi:hypothetical protein
MSIWHWAILSQISFNSIGLSRMVGSELRTSPDYAKALVMLYPVKYFAARDCAPAPNILAAALLPSSSRNKDFA